MDAAHPHANLRHVEKRLLELDAVPLIGNAPPFPIEELKSELARIFHLDGIEITTAAPKWLSREEVTADLGNDWSEVRITLPSMTGEVALLMGSADVQGAMRLALSSDRYARALYDSPLRKAFFRFLVLEVLQIIHQAGYPPGASPRLLEGEEIMEDTSLAIDIHAAAANESIHARLLVSPLFLRAWRREFAGQKPSRLSQELAQAIEVQLGVEGGRVELTSDELAALQPGDLLTLDQCDVEPETGEGRVALTLNGESLFRARAAEGQLTLEE
jgi:flagellar motor switch protein FliN